MNVMEILTDAIKANCCSKNLQLLCKNVIYYNLFLDPSREVQKRRYLNLAPATLC